MSAANWGEGLDEWRRVCDRRLGGGRACGTGGLKEHEARCYREEYLTSDCANIETAVYSQYEK